MAALRPTTPRGPNVLRAIARVARGRVDGIDLFAGTEQGFLASLAPLVAFPLVGGVLMMLGGAGLDGLGALLETLCAVLAPPVLTFEAARRWGRQDAWLRFATAFNWCQWVIPIVGSLMLLVFGVLTMAGLPPQAARAGVLVGLVGYGLWLHCFLARHGLGLSWSQAGLMVVGVNLATVLLVAGPRMLALYFQGAGLEGK